MATDRVPIGLGIAVLRGGEHRKAPTAWDDKSLVDFKPISLTGLSSGALGALASCHRCPVTGVLSPGDPAVRARSIVAVALADETEVSRAMDVMRQTTCRLRDGFELAVQSAGPEDAPPLLLLAGQANSHHWWDGLRERYHDDFSTITLDQRGTGDSHGEVPRQGHAGEWSTESFADDVADVLDSLDIDQVLVHGTSMGGRVAQQLAVRHPDRVRAMVLSCSSPGGVNAVPQPEQVRRDLAGAGSFRARAEVLHGLFYTPAWTGGVTDSTLLGDPTMSPAESRAHFKVSIGHDAWDLLPTVTTPTVVLHGTDDQMVPAGNSELLAERISGATLRLLPAGRHGFFAEFADEVTPMVIDFLLGQWP